MKTKLKKLKHTKNIATSPPNLPPSLSYALWTNTRQYFPFETPQPPHFVKNALPSGHSWLDPSPPSRRPSPAAPYTQNRSSTVPPRSPSRERNRPLPSSISHATYHLKTQVAAWILPARRPLRNPTSRSSHCWRSTVENIKYQTNGRAWFAIPGQTMIRIKERISPPDYVFRELWHIFFWEFSEVFEFSLNFGLKQIQICNHWGEKRRWRNMYVYPTDSRKEARVYHGIFIVRVRLERIG